MRPAFIFSFALLAGAGLALAPSGAAAQDEFGDDDFDDDFNDAASDDEAPRGDGYERLGDGRFVEDEHYHASAERSEEDAPSESAVDSATEDAEWERRFRLHNTYRGPTGGLRLVDARPAPARTLRAQLVLDFFTTSDFLLPDDDHDYVGGAASFSWALFDWIEAFASIESYSNTNNREAPGLFQVVSDVHIGAKVGFAVGPILSLGGDLQVFIPTNNDLDLGLDAWSPALRANATADLRGLASPLPIIGRVNLQYVFDNTSALAEPIEAARYDALDDRRPLADETRHLLTPVERFGLGVNRTDFLNLALGVAVPLEPIDDLVIEPMLEWRLGIPINRQGYDCPFIAAAPGSDMPAEGQDGCLAETGFAAVPMTLGLGVRVLPVVKGFSALLAAEIGLTGTSPEDAVRELQATAPYRVFLGVAYAYDARPDPPPPIERREVLREVEVPADLPPRGRILGVVVDQESGDPLPGAHVHYPAREVTTQRTGTDGRFRSVGFPPGEAVEMHVSLEEHEPGTCQATIDAAGNDVEVRCELARVTQVVVEESEVVILEQINFAFDSAEILSSSFRLMDDIARTLNRHPELIRIEIQGHTDNVGRPRYNQQLSQRRAASVRAGLIERGVDEGRLTAHGYGLERPIAPNDSDANRARNRRVQFIITERAPDAAGIVIDPSNRPSDDVPEAGSVPEPSPPASSD